MIDWAVLKQSAGFEERILYPLQNIVEIAVSLSPQLQRNFTVRVQRTEKKRSLVEYLGQQVNLYSI